ncbi:hypothetical protein [Halalkalibacterium ligniniphilum]|uniref:hypothetical protein n=1 Tax=Halalkalibacterium ligniniphilum TaxID=1134413 RepID=UPI0003475BC3|nr:hypothetical protein [Halalkalibacterium ligniniphilum]
MTTGEMLGFTNRFKEIMTCKSYQLKQKRLANLMSDLERLYQIPLFGHERIQDFQKKNPFVIQLYGTVSAARSL